ncbi:hypothetical protein CBQ28_08980 [Pseudoalteromonas sp. GCY]|uniref:hypothetical protein n=1 Tax=Pseudoalteromonas TaxID=53246 RepID=UPI000BFED636|nr:MULTISPECIES: hypothetical protein [Pseudoalteromonas]MCG7540231.1 hypothetical protein [Pseudoalteromonas sp. OF7H-1]MCG9768408.1 hypothetical protein [Pseudoalteromonas piscicida]PHI37491.1 hypothetical protein CBQ28_08980 [Pseudoalteromonas sp. GCY]QQQ64799.1 hypothetical protein JJQ94_04105 [Pseudoalteromonas sp. GCY]
MALSDKEKDNLRTFLSSLYGAQVDSWDINDAVFDQTVKMLQQSKKCSDLMDLVPRPMTIGQSPINYIKKSARELLLRKLKNEKQHYKVCVSAVAVKTKSKMHMAAMGL